MFKIGKKHHQLMKSLLLKFHYLFIYNKYRIQPNYRPCPHNRPPPLTFYFIFTYYRPIDDLFPDFLLYFHLLSPT